MSDTYDDYLTRVFAFEHILNRLDIHLQPWQRQKLQDIIYGQVREEQLDALCAESRRLCALTDADRERIRLAVQSYKKVTGKLKDLR